MAKVIRKKAHEGAFKFAVALEALRGEKTQSELCQQYGIVSSQLYKWKNELLERGASVFGERQETASGSNKEIEKLHATIGRLKVENDFLEQALRGLHR